MRLAGKSAIVTGGAGGIGRATSLAFAAEGARVWADGHILRPVESEPGLFRGRVSLARRRLADEMFILSAVGRGAAAMTIEPLPTSGE